MAEFKLYEIRYSYAPTNNPDNFFNYSRKIVSGKNYSDAIRKVHDYCKKHNSKVIDIEYFNMLGNEVSIIE